MSTNPHPPPRFWVPWLVLLAIIAVPGIGFFAEARLGSMAYRSVFDGTTSGLLAQLSASGVMLAVWAVAFWLTVIVYSKLPSR
jgi:hypothetical protein